MRLFISENGDRDYAKRLCGLYGVEEAQPLAYVLAFIPSVIFILWFFAHMPEEKTETEQIS